MVVPTHIPMLVSIACSSAPCEDTRRMEEMVTSNLGPLLKLGDGSVFCFRTPGLVQCDVYSSWEMACRCCKQLKDTFTPEAVSTLLVTGVDAVEVECALAYNYRRCDAKGG